MDIAKSPDADSKPIFALICEEIIEKVVDIETPIIAKIKVFLLKFGIKHFLENNSKLIADKVQKINFEVVGNSSQKIVIIGDVKYTLMHAPIDRGNR